MEYDGFSLSINSKMMMEGGLMNGEEGSLEYKSVSLKC